MRSLNGVGHFLEAACLWRFYILFSFQEGKRSKGEGEVVVFGAAAEWFV
jgi:hypothetical protein